MEAGTVTLLERKFQELRDLLAIWTNHRRMRMKYIKRLVRKLCSMHLAVPGAVEHIYHLQMVLAQGGVDRVWLLP